MSKNSTWFKYCNFLYDASHNKIFTFLIILIFLITSVSAAQSPNSPILTATDHQTKSIVWDVTLHVNSLGGYNDNSIFGEAPDASDGFDSYDAADPGGPPTPPYINSYFTTPFPYPNNHLMREIKYYSASNTYKVWNFSVFWFPSDYVTPTTTTISWVIDEVDDSEYTNVSLCTSGGVFLVNMLLASSYTFANPAMVPQNFKIVCSANSPPYVPGSPSPANGSTGVSINADLGWTGGDPDVGDTVTYDVYFGSSSSPPKVVGNQSGTSYVLGTLSYSTTYYWRIVAWDNHGAQAVGPLWHFTTGVQPNQPPYVPGSPSPANGSTGVSINADLGWTGGDPDVGDTVTYDVYFGSSSSPPKVASNISTTIYDPGTLSYFTYYYWKIVAWDNHGASTTGPRWQFRTQSQINHPPYAPSNPNPVNGATEIPINSDLSWTGGDPDSGDYVTYDVYFDTTNPPLTKIKSNTSGTTCVLEDLNYSQKYYWNVVAWDNHKNTNTSQVWSFTTKRDTSGPSLAITSPKKGWVHINLLGGLIQNRFPILITTIVIGPIDVNVTASDSQSGMNRVEFYTDDTLMSIDYTAPYSWKWEHVPFFPYQLKVIAYDNLNNPSTLSLRVWKLL